MIRSTLSKDFVINNASYAETFPGNSIGHSFKTKGFIMKLEKPNLPADKGPLPRACAFTGNFRFRPAFRWMPAGMA
jgi:hypothetical protein